MWKRDSPKSEWDTRVSVLGAFKLDHFPTGRLILFQKISTFLTFILGAPISNYPRERKKGNSRGWKWEKGNHPKVDETHGFLTLGRSNWTICSWFYSKTFPTSWPLYWGLPFLITPASVAHESWFTGIVHLAIHYVNSENATIPIFHRTFNFQTQHKRSPQHSLHSCLLS